MPNLPRIVFYSFFYGHIMEMLGYTRSVFLLIHGHSDQSACWFRGCYSSTWQEWGILMLLFHGSSSPWYFSPIMSVKDLWHWRQIVAFTLPHSLPLWRTCTSFAGLFPGVPFPKILSEILSATLGSLRLLLETAVKMYTR